jgi:LacI family transcriptional regulator
VLRKERLKEVAEHAGVSLETVANVLNRPISVSEILRARVRDSMNIIGFSDDMPIEKQTEKPLLVGIILPTSNNRFFEELTLGLGDAINKASVNLVVGYSREDSALEMQLLSVMEKSEFAAVLLLPVGEGEESYEEFKDTNLRIVSFSQTYNPIDQCTISVDQVRGGYIGIEFLHSLGHETVLWIPGPNRHRQSNQRFVGITQAASQLGVTISTIQSPSLDFLSGEHIAPMIIEQGALPDAIFAANDAVALGIINYFLKEGIKIPEDVSILGFDNIAYAESALIPLSTVSQTPYNLGFALGRQLFLDLGNSKEHIHENIIFQPAVVERDSTRKQSKIAL